MNYNMKNINQYICESKEKEFHYATEGNHDFIDEVVNFIEANGFTKSNNKIIKKMEYSLLNNDYELNIRVKALSKSHPDTSTILVVIRKGDNCNYDYYEKISDESHWHFVPDKKATSFNIHARNYQYTSNGYLDMSNDKIKERTLAHIRRTLHIHIKKQ